MSENTQPQGKGMGVAGFVLALVTLVLATWIAGIATIAVIAGGSAWLMYLWLVLALASVVISAMAMSKLGKSGGKKGLAVAGLVIGIVSAVYCIVLVLGISAAASLKGDMENAFDDIDWDKIEQDINNDLNQ